MCSYKMAKSSVSVLLHIYLKGVTNMSCHRGPGSSGVLLKMKLCNPAPSAGAVCQQRLLKDPTVFWQMWWVKGAAMGMDFIR